MIDREQLQTVLGLSNIIIDRVVFTDPRTLNVYVTSGQNGCACHRCGQWIKTPHGVGAEIRLRHLPMFNYRTEIILKPKRYRCLTCDHQPTTTQTLEWYTPHSAFTKAYEQELLRALINSTIEDVSCKYDVSSDQLDSVIDRSVAQTVDWERFERLDVIGVDEISLKKGHRQYVTVISALIDGTLTILAVLADRTKATVERFFRSIPKRLRRTVGAICSDL
ncbi:transposase, partial [Allochromatium palmeri]